MIWSEVSVLVQLYQYQAGIYPTPVFDPRGVLPRAAPTRRWLGALVPVGWFPKAQVGPPAGTSNPNYPKVRHGAPRRARPKTEKTARALFRPPRVWRHVPRARARERSHRTPTTDQTNQAKWKHPTKANLSPRPLASQKETRPKKKGRGHTRGGGS